MTELECVQVSEEIISDYFSPLIDSLQEIQSEFIFNLGEIGHADWADAHQDIVLIPNDFSSYPVPIPIPSSRRRITLVVCIAADASYLKPFLIVPRLTVSTQWIY
jgi:hypothetical protein